MFAKNHFYVFRDNISMYKISYQSKERQNPVLSVERGLVLFLFTGIYFMFYVQQAGQTLSDFAFRASCTGRLLVLKLLWSDPVDWIFLFLLLLFHPSNSITEVRPLWFLAPERGHQAAHGSPMTVIHAPVSVAMFLRLSVEIFLCALFFLVMHLTLAGHSSVEKFVDWFLWFFFLCTHNARSCVK